jgi:biopolymer transport protein ExbD
MPKLEAMPNLGRAGSRRTRAVRVSSSLAEINVVPLVDVMLVLLVIFMVTAPMMQQGFQVDLPQSRRAPAVDQRPVTITVPNTFRQDQRVRIGEDSIPLATLDERVKQAIAGRANQNVNLAADGQVTVQDLMLVWDALKAGGVTNVNIQTQPPKGNRP